MAFRSGCRPLAAGSEQRQGGRNEDGRAENRQQRVSPASHGQPLRPRQGRPRRAVCLTAGRVGRRRHGSRSRGPGRLGRAAWRELRAYCHSPSAEGLPRSCGGRRRRCNGWRRRRGLAQGVRRAAFIRPSCLDRPTAVRASHPTSQPALFDLHDLAAGGASNWYHGHLPAIIAYRDSTHTPRQHGPTLSTQAGCAASRPFRGTRT